MSVNPGEDAIFALNKVVEATPDLVSPTRWENWKLWKQAADTAEDEFKKFTAKAGHSTFSEEFWQLSDHSEKALAFARKNFDQVEQMVKDLEQANNDAAAQTVAAVSAAQQQAAAHAGDVQMLDPKPEISGETAVSSHDTSPVSISAPAASSSALTGSANGGLSKTASAPGKGQQPVIFEPACDNCRSAGISPCVRSPPPHHRRCTRCAEGNVRCSFKESKATAAAAAAAAHADEPPSQRTLGKRKRFHVPDYDEDASYMLVKAERRASMNGASNGTLRHKVQEAQNLVRTIGFLFEKLDDALEDIAEAAGTGEDSTP